MDGRLAQRLALVITARLSWKTETFCVGIRELGQLWAVTDRTAKRELALMRARGWVVVARAATRGRVTVHRVEIAKVMAATQPYWTAVGPDFAERVGQGGQTAPADTTVVPFPVGRAPAALPPDGGLWAQTAHLLQHEDGPLYRAWFALLAEAGQDEGRLVLAAPSAFVRSYINTHLRARLQAAVATVDPSVRRIEITY
ncbi:DnaA N-terminal domain-containing protein [Yoonia sp.]|uniref:DnaA N-terminal domain-containing protein n=1 Tax=Yoonia sp. TaxID=2212373 RepID=UPI002FD9307A